MKSEVQQYFSKLWSAFCDGDREAYAELYNSLYKNLFSYGNSFNVSEDHVRDIIQDIFMKLYIKPKLISNPDTLLPYVYSSVRNACLNILSSSNKHIKLTDDIDFYLDFEINEDIIESEEERLRISIQVDTILAKLTPRQREIIQLRFLHRMSYEEISSIMNLSEQASRNLVYRAITSSKSNFFFIIYILQISSIVKHIC